jgi:hypothetical protein
VPRHSPCAQVSSGSSCGVAERLNRRAEESAQDGALVNCDPFVLWLFGVILPISQQVSAEGVGSPLRNRYAPTFAFSSLRIPSKARQVGNIFLA